MKITLCELMEIQAWCGTHFPCSSLQRARSLEIVAATAKRLASQAAGFSGPLPAPVISFEMIAYRRLFYKTSGSRISL
jgi:hypothetical protein